MSVNLKKWTRQILKRHSKSPPSLKLDLFDNNFRFEHQDGSFLFESSIKIFLEFIREQRLPVDLIGVFDDAGVKFYDGCLIVEVHDHRSADAMADKATPADDLKSLKTGFAYPVRSAVSQPTSFIKNNLQQHFEAYLVREREVQAKKAIAPATDKAAVEKYKILLSPSPESLWTDLSICSSNPNVKWELSVEDALQVESLVLAYTQPTLCLDPSFEVTCIANHVIRANAAPVPEAGAANGAKSRKRSRQSSEHESSVSELGPEEKRLKLREERAMRLYDETLDRPFVPTFARLGVVEAHRARKAEEEKALAQSQAQAKHAQAAVAAQQHAASGGNGVQGIPASQSLLDQMAASAAQHPNARQQPSSQPSMSLTLPPKNAVSRKPSATGRPMDEGSPSAYPNAGSLLKKGVPTARPTSAAAGAKPGSQQGANFSQQSVNSIVIEAGSPPASKSSKNKSGNTGQRKTKKGGAGTGVGQPTSAKPMQHQSPVPQAPNVIPIQQHLGQAQQMQQGMAASVTAPAFALPQMPMYNPLLGQQHNMQQPQQARNIQQQQQQMGYPIQQPQQGMMGGTPPLPHLAQQIQQFVQSGLQFHQ